jgi:hypothetical protein
VQVPEDLFTVVAEPTGSNRPVLLHSMAGFLDAGSGGRLAVAQLLGSLQTRTLVRFDVDALFDYRARRPRMTFLSDHYDSVELPVLELVELHDITGARFLLLHGVEPDLGWQRFCQAVQLLVERFDVRLAVGLHAVPWPAPHTRPVALTAHASDPELVADRT